MKQATIHNSSEALRLALFDLRALHGAEEIDRFLCSKPSYLLHEMGDFLGLLLPTFGGDKPAVLTSYFLRAGLARAA